MASRQEHFIEKLAPHAIKVAQTYGVPASLVIAQAALESGWGKSVKGNNLFGIKVGSVWHGATVDIDTHEYVDGKRVALRDKFRAYPDLEASIRDHGILLSKSQRYAKVLTASDGFEAADAVERAGYAGDNDKYASQLKAIMKQYDLTRFDDARYQGYSEDRRFGEASKHLADERKKHPGVWGEFMTWFSNLINEVYNVIRTALSGDNSPVRG